MEKNYQYYLSLFKEQKLIFTTSFLVVVMIGWGIIYFTPDKYTSDAKIEITQYQDTGLNELLDAFKTDQRVNKATDEAEILMSSTLIEKAMQTLDFNKKYYTQSGWTTTAVDKSALPFDINLSVASDQNLLAFNVSNITAETYTLTVTRSRSLPGVLQKVRETLTSAEVLYSKTHRFGEILMAPKFQLLLKKQEGANFSSDSFTVYIDSYNSVYRDIIKNLNVTPIIKDSSILEIIYHDSTPERAQKFVNQLIHEYIGQNLADNTVKIEKTLNLIDSQLLDISGKLQKSASDVEIYQAGNLLLNVPDKLQSVQAEINTLQTEKSGVVIQKNIYEKLLPMIKSDQDIGNIVISDESIMNLIAERDAAISKRRELAAKFTDKHSDMIAINQKIESMRQMLNDKIIYSIGNLKTREESINKLISDFNIQVKDLPAKDAHLSELKRQYQVDADIYQELLRSKLQMTTEVTKAQRYNKIVDQASAAQSPSSPKRLLLSIIVLMIAAGISVIVVLVRDYFTVLITKPNDILKVSKIPLFGVLPFIKGNNYNQVYVLDTINTNAAEAYRKIRTNLEYSGGNQNGGKVILVTSSVPNEGKTTFAANLAVVHGMLDAKVLVLNLDLRIPQLHVKFNLANQKGVSEILAGKIPWKDAIQQYASKSVNNSNTHIDVITSGTVPPNPSELLNSTRIDQLFNELRAEYDYIIVDSAPFLNVADTSTLTKKVDVVLFILKSGYSKIEYVANIQQLVKEQEIKSVGCVLTAVQDRYLDLPEYDKNYDLFAKGN